MNWSKTLVWILRGLAICALLVVIALFVLIRFLSSESGLNWTVTQASEASDFQISWESVSGNLIDGVDIYGFSLVGEGLRIEAEKIVSRWNIYDLFQAQLDIDQLEVSNLLVVVDPRGEGGGSWPAVSLPLALGVSESSITNLIYRTPETQVQLEFLEFSGRLRQSDFDIDRLLVNQTGRSLTLSGELDLSPPYAMALEVSWQAALEPQMQLAGRAELIGDYRAVEIQHELLSPLALSSVADITTHIDESRMGLNLNALQFDLLNSWQFDQPQVLPLIDLQVVSSGQLGLQGGVENFLLESDLSLIVPEFAQLPRQDILLESRVVGQRAEIGQLQVNSDLGQLVASGSLFWLEGLHWDLAVALEQISPETFWPGFDGQFDASLHNSGSVTDDGLESELLIEELLGNLSGFPLSAEGSLGYEQGLYRAQNLVLRQGGNVLSLSADFRDNLNAEWLLQAPDLSEVYPQLSGSLLSSGQASGALTQPQVEARLEANSIAFRDLNIDSLKATVSSSAESGGREAENLSVLLDVNQLAYQANPPVNLQLELLGNLDEHQYQFNLQEGENALQLSGLAALIDRQWQAQIETADLTIQDYPQWYLDKPTRLDLSHTGLNLDALCWVNASSDICTSLVVSADGGLQLNSQLHKLEISMLQRFFPSTTRLDGVLEGQLGLTGPITDLEGQVRFGSEHVQLLVETPEANETYFFTGLSVEASYLAQSLSLTARSLLNESGSLSGNMEFPLFDDQAPLRAGLSAHFAGLSWLDPFFPYLSELQGQADVSLDLAGTRAVPIITGDLALRDLSAYVPNLGISVTDGSLSLINQGANVWDLQGRFSSGRGSLELQGDIEFRSPGEWASELNISGENIEAYARAADNLVLSPELGVIASPRAIEVEGRVEVPSARIEVRRLPASTASVSADEEIIGGNQPEVSEEPSIPVYADVLLVLGEDIEFEGFDIQGNLTGQLRLRENPSQTLRATGNIDILNGVYTTYGQQLTIDPGQLIFNGPINNPSLNLRASRTVGDNLVGVEIGGTAQALSSSLYSSPTLSSTETIALLITGRPLASASTNDGELLMNAVTALGLNQSAAITQRLQSSLGLDLLSISADSDFEESSITIGKYLSPKVFISYAQDILTPNASFSLDYNLTENFRIEAKSGVNQSMDIFYRIRH